MTLPLFTIGHSNRSLEDFVGLLVGFEVGCVVDIRKFPRSRTNPQFNYDTLPQALAESDISYEHVVALGGRRSKGHTVARDINQYWTNESFHNYADYALSEEFRTGLEHLLQESQRRRCAIMCSEAVWWRCHRRIVADYLIERGVDVFHIMGQNRLETAKLTPSAVPQPDGTIVYPQNEPDGPADEADSNGK